MFEVGVDTGGTFTDGVLIDEDRKISTAKYPTDVVDPSKGLVGCIEGLAAARGMTVRELLSNTSTVVIGTTIATNMVVSKNGARCCLICNAGFRDLVELSARIPKADPYDLRVPPPEYLIPRHLRFGVEGRIGFDGRIVTPLNEDNVREAAQLAKKHDVQVAVVCFLHSYINPEHEERAGEVLREYFPNVVLSSHVLRKRMEGYRLHTAILSGYVKPGVTNFVNRLVERLKANGFDGSLLFVTSAGGVATAEVCLDNPALMIGSGPAAGPLYARLLSHLAGFDSSACIDIGGTTLDLGILHQGKIGITTEMIVAGHRNATESVDINSIALGGGTIARVDDRGILRIGPESAGSQPGPACYGKGGQRPTTTDADIVLGYIPADNFLGGVIPLDIDMAKEAIERDIARPLGVGVVEAADAMISLAEENAAQQMFLEFVRRGYDPREFVLIVGGGAGPVHAAALAKKLEMGQLYISRHAAVFCPFGMLLADYKHILSRFYYRAGEEIDTRELREMYLSLETEGANLLKSQGLAEEAMTIQRGADMRYFGQLHSIEVLLPSLPPGEPFTEEHRSELIGSFHSRHEALFGRSDPSMAVSVETLKLYAVVGRHPLQMQTQPFSRKDPSAALKRTRPVYFGSDGFTDTPCFDGERLRHGNSILGPAIIEEAATTVVIPPGYHVVVDAYGNYVMGES